jgi:hypothetical protein
MRQLLPTFRWNGFCCAAGAAVVALGLFSPVRLDALTKLSTLGGGGTVTYYCANSYASYPCHGSSGCSVTAYSVCGQTSRTYSRLLCQNDPIDTCPAGCSGPSQSCQ